MSYAIFLHVEAGHSSATAKLLQEYNDVKEQILQIISVAEARAYVHLIYRLAYVSRALNQNVVLWHADRWEASWNMEYIESQYTQWKLCGLLE